ncbi:unnamed protein product [Polarella glacialis]|uniref:EF-hand domain-containing protein n=1 Tax=Polarella glacialis TaxID=89957 RepID=A0A813J654_POLGL|nr:unnamed protein product [Polarella glacialis]CAE8617522.1 unnamed protein product [Polarella glacialis]CAE8665986.1 unnamed protein product [Polarella glacialis]|eukprot:CAMPEP_0115160678 /NCGR_PEP_ID=MMETSP0227-20121206/70947_1 /TAXON_ID=89957 /ORGANISM="Polarella glacialis, Strain CCMP 1383" /LENGTH=259 /DNA_ID=CAMNT_0002572619 /DNA_START=72 /DNA_END=851 /DNA_ORIENTATION=+
MVYLSRSAEGQTEHELDGTSKWTPVALPGRKAVAVESPTKQCSQGHAELSEGLTGAYVTLLQTGEKGSSPKNSITGQALEGTSAFKPVNPLPPASPKQATGKVGKDLRNLILRQTFDAADKDKDGKLSKSELGLMLRRVMPQMSGKALNDAWNTADENHDGSITFEEFVEWLESDAQAVTANDLTKATGNTGGAMLAIFRMCDTDESGTITREELKRVIGTTGLKLSELDLDRVFDAMDKNHDGSIGYQEFTQFLFPQE